MRENIVLTISPDASTTRRSSSTTVFLPLQWRSSFDSETTIDRNDQSLDGPRYTTVFNLVRDLRLLRQSSSTARRSIDSTDLVSPTTQIPTPDDIYSASLFEERRIAHGCFDRSHFDRLELDQSYETVLAALLKSYGDALEVIVDLVVESVNNYDEVYERLRALGHILIQARTLMGWSDQVHFGYPGWVEDPGDAAFVVIVWKVVWILMVDYKGPEYIRNHFLRRLTTFLYGCTYAHGQNLMTEDLREMFVRERKTDIVKLCKDVSMFHAKVGCSSDRILGHWRACVRSTALGRSRLLQRPLELTEFEELVDLGRQLQHDLEEARKEWDLMETLQRSISKVVDRVLEDEQAEHVRTSHPYLEFVDIGVSQSTFLSVRELMARATEHLEDMVTTVEGVLDSIEEISETPYCEGDAMIVRIQLWKTIRDVEWLSEYVQAIVDGEGDTMATWNDLFDFFEGFPGFDGV